MFASPTGSFIKLRLAACPARGFLDSLCDAGHGREHEEAENPAEDGMYSKIGRLPAIEVSRVVDF
jgi:hypothetical protein